MSKARRRVWFYLLALFLLAPLCAQASAPGDGMAQTMREVLDGMNLAPLEEAAGGEALGDIVLSLARGETVWDAQGTLDRLLQLFLGEMKSSFTRMAALIAPALLCGLAASLGGKSGGVRDMAQGACFLALAAVMISDMKAYIYDAGAAIERMAEIMQALFPLLLALLAAVGATAGAAFFQPAVAAAGGTLATLLREVVLRLCLGVAVITLLDSLSPRARLSRLASLFRTAATWILGVAFTVFIGVTALQGVTAAAADGISIRAAKYAVDNFVPVVGGMFADTMDTLVGCSLLIKNALGVTGLMALLGAACAPMLRALCGVMAYRLCAALLQPIAPGRVPDTLGAFSDVLTLLFILQLSMAAMFLLLVAQMLAVGNMTVMLR